MFNLNVAKTNSMGGRSVLAMGVYTMVAEAILLITSSKGDKYMEPVFKHEGKEFKFDRDFMINPTWSTGAENYDYAIAQELGAILAIDHNTDQSTWENQLAAFGTNAVAEEIERGREKLTAYRVQINKKIQMAITIRCETFTNKQGEEKPVKRNILLKSAFENGLDLSGNTIDADKIVEIKTAAYNRLMEENKATPAGQATAAAEAAVSSNPFMGGGTADTGTASNPFTATETPVAVAQVSAPTAGTPDTTAPATGLPAGFAAAVGQ